MRIATARDAADRLAPLFAGAQAAEKVAVLLLDGDARLLGTIELPPGGTGDTLLPLRDIFAAALRIDARRMIVAHNHPSGDARPSAADIAVTRRLADAAASLDIRLDDHLIFADAGPSSMRALGML